MGKIKKIAEVINNIFKIHWFWYTIIIAFPTAWFSIILPFWGSFLGLINDTGLTRIGNAVSIILVIIFIVLVFLNNWYSSLSGQSKLEELEGEIDYLGTITEKVDGICNQKYIRLTNIISKVKSNRQSENNQVPEIITKPNEQLKRIVEGITECLVKFSTSLDNRFYFRDFLVSIAYNFPEENNNWSWVDGMDEKDLTLDELLEEGCDSTFRYLMATQTPYYFNNKKEDAKRERRYYYNKQDLLNSENGEPVGSIFCYNFKIKKGRTVYVDAYLSISTNKKRFAIEDEEICKNTRDNMVSLVKESFGKRICIELCLLYLEYLKNNQDNII